MFDKQVHDYWEPPDTAGSRSLLEVVVAERRGENRCAARRLRAVGELFEMCRGERGETEDWAVDTWAAVGAEIAAALCVSLGRAGSWMHDGLAMRRLPGCAAVFEAGDIDAEIFHAVVYRTGLLTDPESVATVDALIAGRAARWPSLSAGRVAREIDRLVHRVDRDAVRRRRERARDRDVTIFDATDGSADISARLLATDAHVLDERLDSLAATVCDADPRTLAQRRADALGALAAGAQRLACRCGCPQCPAAAASAVASAVVIHVVAEQQTVDGTSDRPGYLLGADTLIPAQMLREIAAAARLRPLIHPADAPAEPQYRPSAALADFVRARDLSCRAPGCDHPATDCDLDHTVPYDRGGPTHASNLKALCRFHHLIKTFWGWRDRQLPDGAVIWDLPGGQSYVTTPGSAWLFPHLSVPTGSLTTPSPNISAGTASMPKRKTTRAQDRAHRITTERNANRIDRHIRQEAALKTNPPPQPDDDPPF